jgi:transketolase
LSEDERVAVLLAEISIGYFEDALRSYPTRVVNIGIMEQALIGVAAGFAMGSFRSSTRSRRS